MLYDEKCINSLNNVMHDSKVSVCGYTLYLDKSRKQYLKKMLSQSNFIDYKLYKLNSPQKNFKDQTYLSTCSTIGGL